MTTSPSTRWTRLTLRMLGIAAAVLSIAAAVTGMLPEGIALYGPHGVLVGHEPAVDSDALLMFGAMLLGGIAVAIRPRMRLVLGWAALTLAALVFALRHGIEVDLRARRDLWPADAVAYCWFAALWALGLAALLALVDAILRFAKSRRLSTTAV